MRETKMGVIIGVLLMFLGIAVFFAFPVLAPWEPRSDVLVEGKTLVVSPGSSDHLSEGPFFSWGEDYLARGYVLKGDAIETGDHEFNFYVLDSDNYTAWDNGKAYTAYYERARPLMFLLQRVRESRFTLLLKIQAALKKP